MIVNAVLALFIVFCVVSPGDRLKKNTCVVMIIKKIIRLIAQIMLQQPYTQPIMLKQTGKHMCCCDNETN